MGLSPRASALSWPLKHVLMNHHAFYQEFHIGKFYIRCLFTRFLDFPLFRKSGKSEYPKIRIFGFPGISEIRFPKIRMSENPKIRICRFPDFRISVNPEIRKSRKSGNPDIWICGNPENLEFWIAGSPDFRRNSCFRLDFRVFRSEPKRCSLPSTA